MAGDNENTPAKRTAEHLVAYQFKPGNPGRPKGARNRLGEAFLNDLMADWEENGAQAIIDMRTAKAADYVKVVASILPQQLNVKVNELDELTDDQLDRRIAAVLALIEAGAGVSGDRAGSSQAPQSIN